MKLETAIGTFVVRSRFRGNRIIRASANRVRVFLSKEAIDDLCPKKESGFLLAFSTTLNKVIVATNDEISSVGCKIKYNADGSGMFVITVLPEIVDLLFPLHDATVFWPKAVRKVEMHDLKFLVFDEPDGVTLQLRSIVSDGSATSTIANGRCDLTTDQPQAQTTLDSERAET